VDSVHYEFLFPFVNIPLRPTSAQLEFMASMYRSRGVVGTVRALTPKDGPYFYCFVNNA